MADVNDSHHFTFTGAEAHDEYMWQNLQKMLNTAGERDSLVEIAKAISIYYLWPLFVIGVPANILALLTILTFPRISPASFLVALLSVLDCTALVAKLTVHQVHLHDLYIGTLGCKFQFLVIFVTTMANWVLLLICGERFVYLRFPLKKASIFTKRRCYIGVALLAVVFLVFFGSISAVMRGASYTGRHCGTHPKYLWFWLHVWYWINTSLFLFLPFLGMLPMTICMVWILRAQYRANVTEQSAESDNEEEEAKQGAFTLMIILAVLFFLVLSLPGCIYFLSYSHSSDPVVEARWILFEQIQFVLVDSTHAINFFLYFLSTKLFRQQLVRLVTCRVCRQTTFTPEQDTNTESVQ